MRGNEFAMLATSLVEVLHDRPFVVAGPMSDAIVDALRRVGATASRADPNSPEAADDVVVVALDVTDGTDAVTARRSVEALCERADIVVFGASRSGERRHQLWWDDLFAAQGFTALDVLRARVWDDSSLPAAMLSTLTVYAARRSLPDVSERLPTAPIPRSAVHPGELVIALRSEGALRRLADGIDPSKEGSAETVIANELAAQCRRLDALRAESDVTSAEASRREVVLREELRELADELHSSRQRIVAAEQDRADLVEQCLRSGQESRLLREERDRLDAALVAPRSERKQRSPAVELCHRGARAFGRRIEARALSAADRGSLLPGRGGRLTGGAAALYRSFSPSWREEMRALFDEHFYVEQRPGVLGTQVDPLDHYMTVGWRQGLDPHPLFDTDWYARVYAGKLADGQCPLEHFVGGGWREGCNPHPLFDVDWYLANTPEVAQVGMNPVVHYLHLGWRDDRDPHPFFDTSRYRRWSPDVELAGWNPLVHYVRYGWWDGRQPNGLFDSDWYVANHPEATDSGLPPYRYFLEVGLRRGDHPSAWAQTLADTRRRSLAEEERDHSEVQLADQ